MSAMNPTAGFAWGKTERRSKPASDGRGRPSFHSTFISTRIVLTGVLLILLTASFGLRPAAALEGPGRYYSETGHTLDAHFLFFFDAHGGLELLGYPITDAFLDPYTGLLIQYFQNARLELASDPETGMLAVRMSPLGDLMGGWEASEEVKLPLVGSRPGCAYYPQSRHSVCYAFLTFFEEHGGPEQLGFPISEIVLEHDRLVQYFQGFRLEWTPEYGEAYSVRVAPLGSIHFDYMGYNRDLLRPGPPGNTFSYEVLTLQATGSLAHPVTGRQDEQTVFLQVLDQNFRPVQNAAVTVVIRFRDEERTLVLPPTDAAGISQAVFFFEGKIPGELARLDYFVSYGTMATDTQDSFRIWW